jgi:hypothetical protein
VLEVRFIISIGCYLLSFTGMETADSARSVDTIDMNTDTRKSVKLPLEQSRKEPIRQ